MKDRPYPKLITYIHSRANDMKAYTANQLSPNLEPIINAKIEVATFTHIAQTYTIMRLTHMQHNPVQNFITRHQSRAEEYLAHVTNQLPLNSNPNPNIIFDITPSYIT